jgi:hypothetical protein
MRRPDIAESADAERACGAPTLAVDNHESLTRHRTTWAPELKHRTTVDGLMPCDCLPIGAQTQDGQTQARVRCPFSLPPLPVL